MIPEAEKQMRCLFYHISLLQSIFVGPRIVSVIQKSLPLCQKDSCLKFGRFQGGQNLLTENYSVCWTG